MTVSVVTLNEEWDGVCLRMRKVNSEPEGMGCFKQTRIFGSFFSMKKEQRIHFNPSLHLIIHFIALPIHHLPELL